MVRIGLVLTPLLSKTEVLLTFRKGKGYFQRDKPNKMVKYTHAKKVYCYNYSLKNSIIAVSIQKS